MIKKEEERILAAIDKLDDLGPLVEPGTKEGLEIFVKLRKYQLKHHIKSNNFTEEIQAKVISGELE